MLEGRPQEEAFCSFVGWQPVPARHCMTIAEILTSMFNQEDRALGPEGCLSVVPTRGWERHRTAQAWGRPFVPTSPNMPSLQTALVYPGACLLEGTNLSEGRGTTTPFSLLGAPFLDGVALAKAVGNIPGAWTRPTSFRPSFSKHSGEVCSGMMIHVENEALFRPLDCYLRIIHAARQQAPEQFEFLDRPYEFETEHPAFDLLTGSSQTRTSLLEGASADDIVESLCPVDEEWTLRVEAAEELVQEVSVS